MENSDFELLIHYIGDIGAGYFEDNGKYIYDPTGEYSPKEIIFLNGGSYELYKVIQHYVKDISLYENKVRNQVAIMYNGVLYDIQGVIKNTTNYIPVSIINERNISDIYGNEYHNLANIIITNYDEEINDYINKLQSKKISK